MKILILSDIQANKRDVFLLIGRVMPELVFLAGDLVDKGWKRRSRWKEFRTLLKMLDDLSITTYVVRGNHDLSPHYEWLMSYPYKHVFPLGLEKKTDGDISFIGVPFDFSNDLSKIRTLETDPPPLVDIAVSHTEAKRRPWLFYIPAQIFITGHFGPQLSIIDNRVFIAMFSFPDQYIIIDYKNRNNFHVEYFDSSYRGSFVREVQCKNGSYSTKNLFEDSKFYAKQVECLLKQRHLLREGLTTRQEAQEKLDKLKVSPNHSREVLACIQ